MSYAFIQNADGTAFVEPSLESIKSAATESSKKLPASDEDWSMVSIVNQPGKNSYPISSFSYILVYKNLDNIPSMNKEKAEGLVHLIYWMITDGQRYAPSLQYVPLPDEVKEVGINGLSQIKFEGKQLFAYDGLGKISTDSTSESPYSIPSWIKNNAKWWSQDKIGAPDFVQGIQFLIKEKIMKIPDTKKGSSSSQQIPAWVKNNAGWWADGTISDNDFVRGIQYLITQGIIAI